VIHQGLPSASRLSAHGRGHPVEAAPGAVALQRVAGVGVGAGAVVVDAAAGAGALRGGNAACLVAGGALHADRDGGLGVAPATDLVRGVDTLTRRVVGQEQCVLDLTAPDGVGEEVQPGDGQRLVGGRAVAGVLERAVEGVLELLQDRDLVLARVDEDGAVLGGRDVPLQTLEDQRVGDLVAGRDDLRVHQVHTDLGVLHAGVVGNDHPVQAVCVGLPYVVDDPVLRVRAVLGVDVMVTGQPQVAAGPRIAALRLAVRGRLARPGQHTAGRQAGAQQTRTSQHGTPRQLRWRQLRVRYGQVERRGQGSGVTTMRVVVVPMPVIVTVVMAVAHCQLLA
jgi:hypothetical protein